MELSLLDQLMGAGRCGRVGVHLHHLDSIYVTTIGSSSLQLEFRGMK